MILVNSMNVSLSNMGFVVFLQSGADAKKTRPAYFHIGATEAQAIALHLDHVAVPRPLTHDLLKTIMDNPRVPHETDGDLRACGKTRFSPKIILEWNGVETEIDSRPSDAIALACASRPQFMWPKRSWTRAGVLLDENDEGGSAQNAEPPAQHYCAG